MTLTVGPLSYRSTAIVDPLTGNAATVTGGALSVSATLTPSGTQDVNLTKVAGATVSQGHGTAATAIRVELPTDGTGVVGLNAGTAIIGKFGIDQTTPGTTNGVQLTPGTTGGLTMYHAVNPANVTGVVVKNSAGQVYGITLATSAAAPAYIKLYDSSSAPTAGAGTIKKALICPASAASTGAGASYQFPNGIAFASGIAYTFVSLVTDADTTQPTASTFTIDIDYK